jgi:hypothetical protein
LFAGENEALLIGWDTLIVLDLHLEVVDGIQQLDLKGDAVAFPVRVLTKICMPYWSGGLLLNVVI